MSQSIVVALPAQVDLAPAPIPADWILAGKPEARSKQLVRSRSIWRGPGQVRKLAFCRQALPLPFGFALRVWNRLARTLTGIFWPDEDAAGDPLAAQPAAGKVSSGLGDVRTKA